MSEWRCPDCDSYCKNCSSSSPEMINLLKQLTFAKAKFMNIVHEIASSGDASRINELRASWMLYKANKTIAEAKQFEIRKIRWTEKKLEKKINESAEANAEMSNKQQVALSTAVKQNKEYAKRISELEAEVARLNCLLTPVTETRNQKIVNDALRSNGGIVRPSADGKRYRGVQP